MTYYVWLLGEYYGSVQAKSRQTAESIALEKLPNLLEHYENVKASPHVHESRKRICVSEYLPIYDR